MELQDPSEREYDANQWQQNLQVERLRYLSGKELAKLFGFPDRFAFPPDITRQQQWKLMGNSLNVTVASKIVEIGLRLIDWEQE